MPRHTFAQLELDFGAAQKSRDWDTVLRCVTELAEHLAEHCPPEQLQAVASLETGSLRSQAAAAALAILAEMKRPPEPRYRRPGPSA